jgi:hypothetical protein
MCSNIGRRALTAVKALAFVAPMNASWNMKWSWWDRPAGLAFVRVLAGTGLSAAPVEGSR